MYSRLFASNLQSAPLIIDTADKRSGAMRVQPVLASIVFYILRPGGYVSIFPPCPLNRVHQPKHQLLFPPPAEAPLIVSPDGWTLRALASAAGLRSSLGINRR